MEKNIKSILFYSFSFFFCVCIGFVRAITCLSYCADFAALIRGTNEGNGADIFIKSCFNSSDADARFATSISRHWHKKSLNVSESASGFCSSGVPFVAIK